MVIPANESIILKGETIWPFKIQPLEFINESPSLVHHPHPKVYSGSSGRGGKNQILRKLIRAGLASFVMRNEKRKVNRKKHMCKQQM